MIRRGSFRKTGLRTFFSEVDWKKEKIKGSYLPGKA